MAKKLTFSIHQGDGKTVFQCGSSLLSPVEQGRDADLAWLCSCVKPWQPCSQDCTVNTCAKAVVWRTQVLKRKQTLLVTFPRNPNSSWLLKHQ